MDDYYYGTRHEGLAMEVTLTAFLLLHYAYLHTACYTKMLYFEKQLLEKY
jgi:hypothetical protein